MKHSQIDAYAPCTLAVLYANEDRVAEARALVDEETVRAIIRGLTPEEGSS